jgi:hypothetical protein
MREYRYLFLASLLLSTLGFYLLYQYNVLDQEDFLWPTVVVSPLLSLTVLSFINFKGLAEDPTYSKERHDAVKQSASTPLSILQSPILWLGVISLIVIVLAFVL